jgi:hypothetical protein
MAPTDLRAATTNVAGITGFRVVAVRSSTLPVGSRMILEYVSTFFESLQAVEQVKTNHPRSRSQESILPGSTPSLFRIKHVEVGEQPQQGVPQHVDW